METNHLAVSSVTQVLLDIIDYKNTNYPILEKKRFIALTVRSLSPSLIP